MAIDLLAGHVSNTKAAIYLLLQEQHGVNTGELAAGELHVMELG